MERLDNIILSPIRLDELQRLIENSVQKVFDENKDSQPSSQPDASEFNKKYISRQQFMRERNIKSDSTPWTWENQGKLTPYKFGKEIFYLRDDVDNLMEKAR